MLLIAGGGGGGGGMLMFVSDWPVRNCDEDTFAALGGGGAVLRIVPAFAESVVSDAAD